MWNTKPTVQNFSSRNQWTLTEHKYITWRQWWLCIVIAWNASVAWLHIDAVRSCWTAGRRKLLKFSRGVVNDTVCHLKTSCHGPFKCLRSHTTCSFDHSRLIYRFPSTLWYASSEIVIPSCVIFGRSFRFRWIFVEVGGIGGTWYLL